MRLTTGYEWSRWMGLAKLIWGLAREKQVTITWFSRTYPWLIRERIEVRLAGTPDAIASFNDALLAAMAAKEKTP